VGRHSKSVIARRGTKIPAERREFDWWAFARKIIWCVVAMAFMLMVMGLLLSGSEVLHQVAEIIKDLRSGVSVSGTG
jgi:hypothetical protein